MTTFSYTVTVIPADGSPSKVIAQGTMAINNGTICTFDPTMLAEGNYTLRISAMDTTTATPRP